MAIDTSKPHLGRIYDYMLGGHHNYEADRQAAAAILKVVPSYPKWARLNRWFLQLVASQWEQAGRTEILDLGSGLPTGGHFNDLLPNAHILFSDIDPLTVAYGEDLLKGQPHMKYIQADVGAPQGLLEKAEQFFGRDRSLAVGCIGISYLIPDEALHRFAEQLHAFCAPGSVMALTTIQWNDNERSLRGNAQSDAIKRYAGMQLSMRTSQQVAEIFSPWQITTMQSLTDWLHVPEMFSAEERSQMDAHLAGVLLTR